MNLLRRCRPARLTVLLVLAGACQSFDSERTQFAIISVPATAVAGGGFAARPTAFFFEGTGVQLSTTQVGAQGCVDRALVTLAPSAFDEIDAGEGVEVTLGEASATLSPTPTIAGTTYQLPDVQSIPFTPGSQITVTIPGAPGGFPARVVRARSVEAFTPAPVALPASASEDLNVTWGPSATQPGTAMFYSFRYSSTSARSFDREVACVFLDDGSGPVPATALSGFRTSTFRAVSAQRALVTAERVGNAITHVTSSLLIPVPVIGDG